MRKSSLVECCGTDNVRRLKPATEAMDPPEEGDGRGALCKQRSQIVRTGGASRRANAGMSSEECGENPHHRKPQGSWAPSIDPGIVGT